MTVMDVPDTSFFDKRYTDDEREELIKSYGQVPAGNSFELSLRGVLSWGNPMWQVYEEVYKRNSRIGSLTEDDNLWIWKCLHVMLARRVLNMIVPSFLGNDTTRFRWREDFFSSASSWLWEILRSGADRSLSPANAIHFTMLKAQTWVITNQTKDSSNTTYLADMVNEVASRRAGRLASVFDEVSSKMDHHSMEDQLDSMVADAISRRFPESIYPGVTVVAKKIVAGKNFSYKFKWLLDFVTTYRRYYRDALRDKERKLQAV